ncbi:MAG: response regulator [Oliverpabstia sp.]
MKKDGGWKVYKVMIIDDEEIVRMGFRDLIDWEKEGYYICAEGKDGKDGLAKLLDTWPDLVLVDIKMPGLSGIDLIKAAREKNFKGHFIILSGYSEFEYAKSAITYGVREYLLKPIDEDELLENIRVLRKELDEKAGEQAFNSSNAEIAREELIRKILLKMDTREKLEEQLELYKMDLSNQIFCVAVIFDKEVAPGNDNNFFIEKTRELLGNSQMEKVLMDDCVVVVNQGMDYKTWAQTLRRQNERIQRKYGKGLSIAVGHNVSMWYDLSHSYEFAVFLMEHEFLFSGCSVMTMDTIEDQQYVAENPSVDYFCMLIEVGDMEGIQECVKIFKQYCIKKMMKELDIKIMVMYNIMQIKNWAEQRYDGGKEINISQLIDQLNRVEELDELMELYCHILQNFCIKVGCDGSETVIKRMYYYMEKNYDKDLKLETFAKLFNYNSNYLGKVFRKEIGDSFNNILDSIRITNAKRLLTKTDLKVYQISERVGYSNIDYFYLKFKKYVGISPKEYKKECRQAENI